MAPQQGHRLDQLLAKQGDDPHDTGTGRTPLMQVYQQLWVRQSEALAEAVRRGRRGPRSRHNGGTDCRGTAGTCPCGYAADRCRYCRTSRCVPWRGEVRPYRAPGTWGLRCRGQPLVGLSSVQSVQRPADPWTRSADRAACPPLPSQRQRWRPALSMESGWCRVLGAGGDGPGHGGGTQPQCLVAITVRRHWVTAGWHPPHD